MFDFSGFVKKFLQKGGWYYVSVPVEFTDMSRDMQDRGLVPIKAQVGNTKWNTSFLPMGDGTHFVALNKKVREKHNIGIGDKVRIKFTWR